jgi:D-proline reductase (dithiol) PrdB
MTPVKYIDQTRALYDHLGYPPYSWYQAPEAPTWSPMQRPLSESRLGMISTAGTYVAGQTAYFYKDDTSIRKIDSSTQTSQIRFSHLTENYLVEARQDPATVFPIEALNRLNAEGFIGGLATSFYSCMGGIYSQRRVNEELIPALQEVVKEDSIDCLLLVPL